MITVYSKNTCAHCVNTKQYLEEHNIEYKEVNLDTNEEAKRWIIKQGFRTVPQIYKDNMLIEGGFQGLIKQPLDQLVT
jgi:glutaredoxin-like protein NrdH